MEKKDCSKKHILDPIPENEFNCPKCGAAGGEHFAIWDPLYDECEETHSDDIVSCDQCEGHWTMKKLIQMYLKRKDQVSCPSCSGTGYVPSELDRALAERESRLKKGIQACRAILENGHSMPISLDEVCSVLNALEGK